MPTQLSVLRIILTFIIIAFLLVPGPLPKALALAGFVVASFTDWLDGYLARRWRQTSPFGALIDPIADKVLTLGLFAAFVCLGLVPLWMAMVIAVRELLITGVRLVVLRRQIVLPAAAEGKHKMVSQVVCLTMLLTVALLRAWPGYDRLSPQVVATLHGVVTACLWVTVTLTAVSGIAFFWRHRVVLRQMAQPSSG